MAQNFQITSIDSTGRLIVLHPETNADHILTGATYRIPTILNILDWEKKSEEVVDARKGHATLRDKIDKIDLSLKPEELLNALLMVDGTGSKLDADKVDGKDVNDDSTSSASLWTASKIITELSRKVETSQVVDTAYPGKILKLNRDGKLSTDLVGNANTASSFAEPVEISLIGDVKGSFKVNGGELNTIEVETTVLDNSHKHRAIDNDISSVRVSTGNIAEFVRNGVNVSSVDSKGDFTGSASAVNGVSVNNSSTENVLWTGDKVLSMIGRAFEEGIALNGEAKVIRLGVIKICYGVADIATKTSIDIALTVDQTLKEVLFDGFSVATSDTGFICNKKATGATKTGVGYAFNKAAATGSKLTWFIVGV